MEEPKLSPKEQALLEPLAETDLYLQGLKPVLQRWANGIAAATAEQSTDWDNVVLNRGKLQMLKQLNKFIKHVNTKGRKKSS